jgi:hypothetical protein
VGKVDEIWIIELRGGERMGFLLKQRALRVLETTLFAVKTETDNGRQTCHMTDTFL